MTNIITFVLFIAFTLSTILATHAEDRPDIVAASNLITDCIYTGTDSFIEERGLKKGDTTIINAAQADALKTAIGGSDCEFTKCNSGGSAANTIVGINALGRNVGLIGTLADDEAAIAYKAGLDSKRIQYRLTPAQEIENGSGACWIFITKTELEPTTSDGSETPVQTVIERTMATSLGVSGDIRVSPEDIAWASSAKILLIEGYLFSPPTTYESICKLAQATKANGNMVALTLSAEFCVERSKCQIETFIQHYTDIVVGNNNEVRKLTGTETPLDSAIALSKMTKKGAVTCGHEGAYVFDETGIYHISPPSVEKEKIIDTTGAGDQFAAGFLHEILKPDSDIIRAGQLGSFCAGEVIQILGGHPPETLSASTALGIPWKIGFQETTAT